MTTATISELRSMIKVGQVWDVTNHYITREDHPSFGTTRRTVTEVNSSSFHLDGQRQGWPKASAFRFVVSDKGQGFQTFGGGATQAPGDLFLTFTPVATR